jgi:hypothetical protein
MSIETAKRAWFNLGAPSKAKYWFALLVAMFPPAVVFLNVTATIGQFESKNPFFRTNGTVAKLDCANHGHYLVAYEVDGHAYTEAAANLYLNGTCKSLRTDQSVDVWVSRKDASYVSLISPISASKYMASERRSVLFVYPIFAIFALAAVRFRTTRKPT